MAKGGSVTWDLISWALDDEDVEVRRSAAKTLPSLARNESRLATIFAERAIIDSDNKVRLSAIKAIQALDKDHGRARELVLKGASSGDINIRRACIDMLPRLYSEEVLRGVAIDLLKNTDNSLCLNTSSSTGIIGLPMTSVYSASKHAVKGLTESLSAEFKRFGVKVSDILPGVIDTPIISQDIRSTLPSDGMWRLIPAEDIAKTVYRAYEDDKIHWYVPEDLEDLEKLVVEDPIKARDEVISTGPMKMPIE